jgi:hypothetical protein
MSTFINIDTLVRGVYDIYFLFPFCLYSFGVVPVYFLNTL